MRHLHRAFFLTIFFLFPNLADASLQYPNLDKGFASDASFQVGDIDNVNLFNGNLVLNIPIGQAYSMSESFDYRLQLTYNSKLWDFYEDCIGVNCYDRAVPDKGSNAGLGWRLSLGELIPPDTRPANPQPRWLYVTADGGEHTFYDTLHENEPVVSGVYYSRDGSYLRLKIAGSTKTVEHPDGSTYTFGADNRIQKIEDRFGNRLSITYPSALRWTLSDSTGRSHSVFLRNMSFDGETFKVVDRVELAAFGNSKATYRFAYAQATVERPCPASYPNDDPAPSLPLLVSLTLPDGSKYDMPAANYQRTRTPGICRATGTLTKLRLPTLGYLAWTFDTYRFPEGGEALGDQYPPRLASRLPGVVSRRVLSAGGSTLGQWTYDSDIHVRTGEAPVQMTTTVVNPLGHKTVHYFSAYNGGITTTDAEAGEYGLPFSVLETDGDGRYISQKIYQGSSSLKRSVYVRYERDPGLLGPGPANERNQRLQSQRLVYHDDGGRYADTTFSDFDGLGHYRHTRLDGNFPGSNPRNVRVDFTNYNDGRGTFPSNFTMLPASSAWVLETFTEKRQQESGVEARQQFCFDSSTGFLKRQRTLANGTSTGNRDLVAVFVADGAGNTKTERYHGGDQQSIGLSENLCGLGLPTRQYRIDKTWIYGALATSKYAGAAHKTVDRTIDKNTGLPSQSRDVSGLPTDLIYDTMGRRTWQRPSQGAWVQTVHQRATSASSTAARTTIWRPNGATSGELKKRKVIFDFLGRPVKEQVLLPGHSWSTRQTNYNILGWTTAVSELSTQNTPPNWTTFSGFDAFGRAKTVDSPDGSRISYTYAGDRAVVRTAKVGTHLSGGNVAQTSFSTTFENDRFGRLVKVVEPAGGLTAEYWYEVGGSLHRAKLSGGTTQNRYFHYDQRGFLTSESHPENGLTEYLQYDARGNLRRSNDGLFDLVYELDSSERLTRIREQSGRVHKSFTYATSNGTGNWRLGKRIQAVRHNHVRLPWNQSAVADITVTEDYTYGGVGGRISRRNTSVSDGESFTQSWSYNDLGQVSDLTYPRCTHGGCTSQSTSGPARTVSFTYDRGYLTAVPGYATSITYHPNGTAHRIARANTVTDIVAKDPNDMQRPGEISVTGPFGLLSLGPHGWDGSGNLISRGARRFTYDGLSRLRSYEESSTTPWQKYQYDAFGNLNWIQTFDDAATTLRTIQISPSSNRLTMAPYDAAGNMTGYAGTTYDYDPFKLLTRKNKDVVYLYTADDERLKSLSSTSRSKQEAFWTLRNLNGKALTRYFNSGAVNGTWEWEKDYVYRGSSLLAAARPGSGSHSRHHFTLDHLGSPRLTTLADGNTFVAHNYFGFGEEFSNAQDSEPLRFTGHERDFNLTGSLDDLDYMHARYYSPYLGRFLSVDPARESALLRVPQSWNRYSYVRNNPLKFVDPNGEAAFLATALIGGITDVALTAGINAIKGEPLLKGTGKAFVRGAVVGATGLGVIKLAQKGTKALQAARVATSASDEVARGAGAAGEAVAKKIDPNKLHHIFGQAKHNLDDVVTAAGSEEKAFLVLEDAIQAIIDSKKTTGLFKETVEVFGVEVTIQGKVVNGIARIGTAYR